MIDCPLSIDGDEGVMPPAASGLVTAKAAVIVPVAPMMAVVDAEEADPKVIEPLLALQDVKDQKALGLAATSMVVPLSYQPVSPVMGGEELVDALPAEAGFEANVTWY